MPVLLYTSGLPDRVACLGRRDILVLNYALLKVPPLQYVQ